MTTEPGTSPVPAEASQEAGATPAAAPAAKPVGSWPMWVLGLVIMIDQIDQNIVRGVGHPLQEHFHLSESAARHPAVVVHRG